ncbi:MAG: mechanosensitive ion channel family protein [Bryobacteraceae bacterium]|nr:mechanosensitive ion channel family protein [Bryobacteraceae bacterium]
MTELSNLFRDLDDNLIRILHGFAYLLGAALLTMVVSSLVRRLRNYWLDQMRERKGVAGIEMEKQTRTMASLMRRLAVTVIWALGIALALGQFGLNVAPLLAGAGVAGIAIGFAAQSILKDWINGFFLLTEGQIRIHDVIQVGNVTGAVEKMTLRTIALRGFDGALHVIANGTVQSFTNKTLLFSYYVFEIGVDYSEDPARMMQLMREVDQALRDDAQFGPLILEPLDIVGVDRFAETGVIVKARLKTLPSQQWRAGREFNKRLQQRCGEAGLAIATAQRAVQLFERGDPAAESRRLVFDPLARQELKEIVREVVREER